MLFDSGKLSRQSRLLSWSRAVLVDEQLTGTENPTSLTLFVLKRLQGLHVGQSVRWLQPLTMHSAVV